MLKKKFKKALGIFQALLTIILVLAVLLLVFTAFNPMKNYRFLRVMSGSMEPTIKTGAVVLIQKVAPEALRENDIITFGSADDPNLSITHRLVKIEEKEGETVFKTRGDANNSEDINEVSPADVQGKVIFSLPLLGYLAVFIKEPLGFGLLVVLPAILIIISEILNIKKAIEEEVEKKYAKENLKIKKSPDEKITGLFIFLLFLGGIFLAQSKPTNAYFSDTAVVGDNTFSMASDWTAPPTPLLLSPGSGVKIKASDLYLDWSDVSDPQGPVKYEYRLYLENPDVNPSAPIRYQQDYYEPTSRHPAAGFASGTPNGEYWWRVRACDQLNNCSAWTPAWRFIVDNSLSDPSDDGTDPFTSDIVLNEILPDPVGDDNAVKPNGEWVELYNKSDKEIDVAGWYLYDDAIDAHALLINGGQTNTGSTKIPAHGFLVVYRNSDSNFSLNQDSGKTTVQLYNGPLASGTLIDSHTYTGPVKEGKSIARIPDGGDTWYDPIPTPGGPNRLEETLAWSDLPSIEPPKPLPELDFYLEKEKAAVGFRAVNISQYKSLDYQVLYQADGIEKGINGQIPLQGENEVGKSGLLLGTCSQGVCVYDQKITKIDLNVKLKEENGEETSLSKSLNLENQR